MTLNYTKVWNSMNDLNDTITNYLHIKELLQSYKKNDKFLDCIVTLLDHYIDTQDQTFKVAWNETVSKINSEQVNKYSVSVQEIENGDTGEIEYFIQLPDNLLEQLNWKENDCIEWIDQSDGSYLLKKNNDNLSWKNPSWVEGNQIAKTKTYDEMIADGWTMTDDGFWIKE